MIGQTISHYRILEKLGEGGMGIVYKAEDTKLRRPVALKVLPRQAVITEEDKTRFAREAQAAASLSHPNVAMIHEFDEVDDPTTGGKIAFIAMEYVDGETVKKRIQERPLPINEAIDIAIAVAEGLAKAHEKGVIHRDMKSENVMISRDGVVKIMDFGLAEIAGRTRVTKEGMTVGTAAYMSPEQALGEKLDQRTDIWSLGVVLYEMITGRLPFPGDYEQAIVYRIMNEEPEPITSLRSNVPMELERIVKKALGKAPDSRYQHADELLVDLKALKKDRESATKLPLSLTKPAPKRLTWRTALPIAVGVLVLIIALIWILGQQGRESPIPTEKKFIAVLPFTTIMKTEENEIFCEGLHDDIITQIAKISDLKVIARTSVIQYKDTKKRVREIASELGVYVILEGSVRRIGDRIRVVAQLINGETEEHLWAETYDGNMSDIFAIQSDIARKIATELWVRLSPTEKALLDKKPTANLTAYDDYLNARFYWSKRTREGTWKAVEFFEAAIAKDSNYALAYSGIADCYEVNAGQLLGVPVEEAKSKARTFALRAVALDSNLVEPRTVLAQIRWLHDWDLWGADEEFKQALRLNPNDVTSLRRYAYALVAMGRGDEAIHRIEQAYRLDPASFITNLDKAILLRFTRRYDEAIAQCEKTLKMDPEHTGSRWILAESYREKGMKKEAAEEYQRNRATFYVQLCLGNRDNARGILENRIEREKPSQFELVNIANQYASLGESEKAFEWLQKSYLGRSPWLIYLKVFSDFDKLRNDPRFKALAKKLGLEK